MGEFDQSLQIGRDGKELVFKLLEKLSITAKIEDVREKKQYQQSGIDFLWWTKDNKSPLQIEVKAEKNSSSNLFIETISNCNGRSPGWIYQTRADYIIYLSLDNQKAYIFRPEKMRKLIKCRSRKLKIVNPATKGKDGRVLYYAEGFLISVNNCPGIENVIKDMSAFEKAQKI
jgi:hypothetical protein